MFAIMHLLKFPPNLTLIGLNDEANSTLFDLIGTI